MPKKRRATRKPTPYISPQHRLFAEEIYGNRSTLKTQIEKGQKPLPALLLKRTRKPSH